MQHRPIIFLSCLSILLSGCSSPGVKTKAADELCSGTKRPYAIKGITYYPQEHYDYEEEGQASWYGPNFDGKPGSCGSRYDMLAATAAHKTLPIPSVVEVTNLENGRKLKLVVNDRGPFIGDRIIDLSKKAAIELGTHTKGLGNVRVRALPEDSIALANYLKQFGRYGIDPSGRAWDTIYREEIAGQLEDKPHLLTPPPGQAYLKDHGLIQVDNEVMASIVQEHAEELASPSTKPNFYPAPEPEIILEERQVPQLQSVSYTSPLSTEEQENFEVLLEDLTVAQKNTAKKTLSLKKDLPNKSDSVKNNSKGAHHQKNYSQAPSNQGQKNPKNGAHFVYVGSFVNQQNARKLIKNLSAYGKANVVRENPQFYTVQLGPYPCAQKAKSVMSTVANKGHHGVRLTTGK